VQLDAVRPGYPKLLFLFPRSCLALLSFFSCTSLLFPTLFLISSLARPCSSLALSPLFLAPSSFFHRSFLVLYSLLSALWSLFSAHCPCSSLALPSHFPLFAPHFPLFRSPLSAAVRRGARHFRSDRAIERQSGRAREQQRSKRRRMNPISGDVFSRQQNDEKLDIEALFVILWLLL
jgi:hypothetical protein